MPHKQFGVIGAKKHYSRMVKGRLTFARFGFFTLTNLHFIRAVTTVSLKLPI
jgi:hypothetical protein